MYLFSLLRRKTHPPGTQHKQTRMLWQKSHRLLSVDAVQFAPKKSAAKQKTGIQWYSHTFFPCQIQQLRKAPSVNTVFWPLLNKNTVNNTGVFFNSITCSFQSWPSMLVFAVFLHSKFGTYGWFGRVIHPFFAFGYRTQIAEQKFARNPIKRRQLQSFFNNLQFILPAKRFPHWAKAELLLLPPKDTPCCT